MALIADPSVQCIGNTCLAFIITSIVVFFILLISIFFLYPFYVLSFRKNREKDESTNLSIFYILKHFYHVVNFMEMCFLVNFIAIIVFGLNFNDPSIPIVIVTFSTIFISLIIIISVTMMENIMLSALAIHRFLLYFYPRTEKILTASLKTISRIVTLLYMFIFLINFVQRTVKLNMIADTFNQTGLVNYQGNTEMNSFDMITQRVYFGLIIFLFLSASLYLPMIFSIKKLTKMQSVRKSQPEKPILYQTLFLVAIRLLYLPAIVFICASFSQFNETLLFFGMITVDICVTHFIIQASYLSCNKKQVELLFNSCTCRKNIVEDFHTQTAVSSTGFTN